MIVKLYLDYFPYSKMAISEHKNGHFEEIRGWLQILELVSNFTIFHLLFDTYDSPGAVFIWKWEKYRPYLLVWLGLVHFSSTLYQKGVSWWCHWSPIRSLHIGGICHFPIWLWLNCNPVQNSDVIWTPSYFFMWTLKSLRLLYTLSVLTIFVHSHCL